MLMHGVGFILFLALLIGGVILLIRFASSGARSFREQRSPGLEVLEERYARGEINRDEYLQKKRDLGG